MVTKKENNNNKEKNKTLMDKQISLWHSEHSILAEMAFPFHVGTAVRVGRELM